MTIFDATAELKALQQIGAGYEQYLSSRDFTYTFAAEATLKYLDFEKVPDFLDAEYKAFNIPCNKVSRKRNLRSYAFLITQTLKYPDFAEKKRYYSQEMDRLGNAIQALLLKVEGDPDSYKTKGVERLVADISDAGGLEAFKKIAKGKDPSSATKGSSAVSSITGKPLNYALAHLEKMQKQPGQLLQGDTHVYPNSDGLFLLICKEQANGDMTMLGSTSHANLLAEVAFNARKLHYGDLPLPIHQLAEVISTQRFPTTYLSKSKEGRIKWREKVYIEKTKAKPAQDILPQILLKASGEIIYSSVSDGPAVVTRLKPAKSIATLLQRDVVLDSKHCTQLEEWIDSGQVALLSSKTSTVVSDEKLHKVYVDWACTEPKREKGELRFLPYAHSDGPVGQMDFAFTASRSWTAEFTLAELHRFRRDYLEAWFKSVRNNQLKRDENRLFKLILGTHALTLRWRDDGTTTAVDYPIAFNAPIGNTHSWQIEVMSKDIAPVLYNLAKAECQGNVSVSADKEAIYFSYDTPTGRYDIAVPSASKSADGEFTRIGSQFSQYKN